MIVFAIGTTLEKNEKDIIKYAYKYFEYNKTQTALALGIATKTLDNKLKKYEEEDKEIEDAKKIKELTRKTPKFSNEVVTTLIRGASTNASAETDSRDEI